VAWRCPRCLSENPDDVLSCASCSTPRENVGPAAADPTKTLGRQAKGFETGQIVAGRYQIVECLGQGGMGKVYKAHDLEVHEDVALKLIRPDIASDEGTIQRFQNEMKLTRRIAHRNVCRMFDIGKEGPDRFITMEFVPGEDLKSTIQRIGTLTVRKTLDIGKQICQGLSEAHRQGVIHRDLKPSNIIVDRSGNVHIMDFGIALSRETEGLTDPGAVPGTIEYLAPEVLDGKKPDAVSDIYSLGVILYEMLTGRVPFRGRSTYQVAAKHLGESPRDPALLNPSVSPALGRLILKCLAKDPARRYQKAEDVCAALGRIEKGLPEPVEGTWPRRLWQGIRRMPRFRRFVAIDVPLALVAAVIVYLVIPSTPDGREQDSSGWKNSIIVVPLKHENMKDGQDHIWPTLTGRIIEDLGKFKTLKVTGYDTAYRYKDSTLPDRDIGKRVKADNVLRGVITSENDGFDVRVELGSLTSGGTVFSKDYISPTEKELYPIADEIAQAVAAKLGVVPAGGDGAGIKSRDSTNPEANRYYQYGLKFKNAYYRSEQADDFESSVKNFRMAIDLDPRFARVYWELGTLYEIRFVRDKAPSDLAEMNGLLEEAYREDPDLPESNVGMGWVYFNREDHDQAYRFFKRAYQLDMNSALINYHIGSFLRSLGLYAQARTHYARALALDPVPGDFAVWHQVLADCETQIGLRKEAADVLRQAMAVNPDPHLSLDYAVLLIKEGRRDEAAPFIVEAERQFAAARLGDEGTVLIRRHKALLDAASGLAGAARDLIKDEGPTANHVVVSVYALLGMKEKAVDGIRMGETGFAKYRWYPYSYLLLKNNPLLDNLRRDPAFESILQSERELYEGRLKKYGDL
jgi:serine/threonine protein kinase/tetratricopeptide (TPR) repeat protein